MHDELFDVLRRDHAEIIAGFHQLAETGDRAQRERLVSRLCVKIDAHLSGEEKAVYPSLDKTGEARESALKAREEHHVVRIVLEELLETPGDDDRFAARAAVLLELLVHHIEEEERVLFAMFTRVVDADEAQGVLDGFQKERTRKKRILEKGPVTA